MPTTEDVMASLNAADQAANDAYNAAVAANPDGDLKTLHQARMKTADALATAIGKALNSDPAVTAAQQALDTATADINAKLATLKNLAAWLALLNNLASLAADLAKFLV